MGKYKSSEGGNDCAKMIFEAIIYLCCSVDWVFGTLLNNLVLFPFAISRRGLIIGKNISARAASFFRPIALPTGRKNAPFSPAGA